MPTTLLKIDGTINGHVLFVSFGLVAVATTSMACIRDADASVVLFKLVEIERMVLVLLWNRECLSGSMTRQKLKAYQVPSGWIIRSG